MHGVVNGSIQATLSAVGLRSRLGCQRATTALMSAWRVAVGRFPSSFFCSVTLTAERCGRCHSALPIRSLSPINATHRPMPTQLVKGGFASGPELQPLRCSAGGCPRLRPADRVLKCSGDAQSDKGEPGKPLAIQMLRSDECVWLQLESARSERIKRRAHRGYDGATGGWR